MKVIVIENDRKKTVDMSFESLRTFLKENDSDSGKNANKVNIEVLLKENQNA